MDEAPVFFRLALFRNAQQIRRVDADQHLGFNRKRQQAASFYLNRELPATHAERGSSTQRHDDR